MPGSGLMVVGRGILYYCRMTYSLYVVVLMLTIQDSYLSPETSNLAEIFVFVLSPLRKVLEHYLKFGCNPFLSYHF